MLLEDLFLSVDYTASTILKTRTLDSSSSDSIFIFPKSELGSSNTFLHFRKYDFNKNQSSFGKSSIFGIQMPSSTYQESEPDLTKISMEMGELSFNELWRNEDDSYWDSY